jgi:restriction endonuclease S subunit
MADRPATPHYGIVKYGPQGTADPMDVYAVYNEAMETIDRILFDLQAQIARNKKAIEDLDAKVEQYNTALNTRIDELDAKVEEYHEEFKQFKATTEQKFTQVDNHFTQLDGKTDSIWTAIQNIINKVMGAGSVDKDTGAVSWPQAGTIPVGNINIFSGTGFIRTRAGEQDNDVKVV